MIFRIAIGLILFLTPFIAYTVARWASRSSTPWPMKALTGFGLFFAIVGSVVMGLALEQTDPPVRLKSDVLEKAGERESAPNDPPGR